MLRFLLRFHFLLRFSITSPITLLARALASPAAMSLDFDHILWYTIRKHENKATPSTNHGAITMLVPYEFNTDNNAYHVKSHGNGWAYEVTDNTTGESLWFQDDDANQLRLDTAEFGEHTESVLRQYFECLCE